MVIDGTTASYLDLPRRKWIRSDDGYRAAGLGHQATGLTKKKTSGPRRPRRRASTTLHQDDKENWPPSGGRPPPPSSPPPAKKSCLDVFPSRTAGDSWLPQKEQEPPHVGIPPSSDSWLPEKLLVVPSHEGMTPSFDYRIPQEDQDLPRLSTAHSGDCWLPPGEQKPPQGVKTPLKDYGIPPGLGTPPSCNSWLPLRKQAADSTSMKTSELPHTTTPHQKDGENWSPPTSLPAKKRLFSNVPGHVAGGRGHSKSCTHEASTATSDPCLPQKEQDSSSFLNTPPSNESCLPKKKQDSSSLLNAPPSSDSWLQQKEKDPPHLFAIPSCDFWLPPEEEEAHHHVGTSPSTDTWLPPEAQEHPRQETPPPCDPWLPLEEDHHHSSTSFSSDSRIPLKEQVLPSVGTSPLSDTRLPPKEQVPPHQVTPPSFDSLEDHEPHCEGTSPSSDSSLPFRNQVPPHVGTSPSYGSCLSLKEEVPPRLVTDTLPPPDTLQETAIYSLTREPVAEGPKSSPVSLSDKPSDGCAPLPGAPFVPPVTSAVSYSGIQEQPSQISEALSTTEAVPNIKGYLDDHLLDLSGSSEQRKSDRVSSSNSPQNRPQHPCTRDHLPGDYSLNASPNLTVLDSLNHHEPGILQHLYPSQEENTNPQPEPGVTQTELSYFWQNFHGPQCPTHSSLSGKDNLQKPTDREAMVYPSACQTHKEETGIQDQTHPVGESVPQATPDSETSPTPVPVSPHEPLTRSPRRESRPPSHGVGSYPVSSKTFHDASDAMIHFLKRKQAEHKCKTCGTTCRGMAHLRVHEKMHRNNRDACSLCGKTFSKKKVRAAHVVATVCTRLSRYLRRTDKGWGCSQCPQASFDTRKKAEDHAVKHEYGKGYNCPVCGVHFDRKDDLLHHAKYFHQDYYRGLLT